MLNRAALIVRPAQRFIDWALSLDDSGLAPSPDGEQTVYLIPQFDDEDELEEILADLFETIFEDQLAGWHTVEPDWPQDRTLAMFRRWFTIEYHTMIDDLVDGPLIDDELENEA